MCKNKNANLIASAAFVALATGLSSQAHAGETVEIQNFVGTIHWANGPLEAVIMKNGDKIDVETEAGLVIDGGIEEIDEKACRAAYAKWSLDWGKKTREGTYGGYEGLKDYPVLKLSLPKDTDLVVRNAVLFTLGEADIGSADLHLNYCGNITLGRIAGDLTLNATGSSDLSFGEAASANLNLRGSGDVDGGDITGAVTLDSRGSGDVDLGDVGPLTADLRGSGDLDVGDVSGDFAGGARGSGDVDMGDIRGDVVFISRGSGDWDTGDVTAETVEIEVSGSASLEIGGGDIKRLSVTATGSSDITIDATVGDANVRTSGSGDVEIERVTGRVETKSSGSGKIKIDQRD